MFARHLRIVTLFVYPFILLTACTPLVFIDECGATERAVLAEFPLYGNVSVAPEFNPNHTGCVLAYSTIDTPAQVLAYFAEQLEAHNWKGVPHFASGEYELSAYRDHFSYGVRVGEGQIVGQEMAPGSSIISVVVEERPDTPIDGFEPNAGIAGVELSEEELEKFIGEYELNGQVEAIVTLVDGQLLIRKPGRLVNHLIPVTPTRFRIENFSDIFGVEFEISEDAVESMKIVQNFTGLHTVGGSMLTEAELIPVQ